MSINFHEKDERKVLIPCGVGCLRHVIGITWFRWRDGDPDEPEMYFETLHEPYEGFWMRLWRAWQFVVQKKPHGVDSTLVTVKEAQKLIDACKDYQDEWLYWANNLPEEHQPNKGK